MAIRELRLESDPLLRKVSKPVREMTPRIADLIDDMMDTMYEEDGVGLAAPQVGVLRRIFVTDVAENPTVFINPEIIEKSGVQWGTEGCLSLPGQIGVVRRPQKVKVRALDREMKEFTVELEDLAARAACHELDHLNGILYKDVAYIMNDKVRELMNDDELTEYLEALMEEEEGQCA